MTTKPARKPKRPPQEKLKGAGRAAFEEFEARLKETPNPHKSAGQLRLLEVGVSDFTTRIPEVVLYLLDEAAPISVAEATERAPATGKSWQDHKATLELQLKLIRARAKWEREDPEGAKAEFTQVSASPSSRRAELILEAAARFDTFGHERSAWSPAFSLALLRSASTVFANSVPAALALIDAMTGVGELPAAALILSQLIAARAAFPDLTTAQLSDRIARLSSEQRPPLEAALNT